MHGLYKTQSAWLYKWFTAYSWLMPCFCISCHSNHIIERALAQSQENLALVQCKFASNISCKQGRMSFIQVVSHLTEAAAFVSLAQTLFLHKPRLMLSTAFVRQVPIKRYHLYCKSVLYVSSSLCNPLLIFLVIINGPIESIQWS